MTAEGLRVGESISVEVTRAGPFGGTSQVVGPSGAGGASPETIFVVIGVIVVLAIISVALSRYVNSRQSLSRGDRFLRAFVTAGVFGFCSFLISGSGFAWIFAVGLFYYDFLVRGR